MTMSAYVNINLISVRARPCRPLPKYRNSENMLLKRMLLRVMVFNTTYNHMSAMSWLPILLVEETGVPGENYRHLLHIQKLMVLSS